MRVRSKVNRSDESKKFIRNYKNKSNIHGQVYVRKNFEYEGKRKVFFVEYGVVSKSERKFHIHQGEKKRRSQGDGTMSRHWHKP